MASDNFEAVAARATGPVASFEQKQLSFLEKLQRFLHHYPTAAPTFVLIIAILGFYIAAGPRFLSPFNLSLILQQITVVGIIGVAQTLVILTAGIDLSVGAIMVLSSVVMGRMAIHWGVPAVFAIMLGFMVGFICGYINGFLITRFRLPPFITTLGTLNIFLALNLWYSKSESIRSQDIDAQAPFLKFLGYQFEIWGASLTLGTVTMLLLFVFMWYMLKYTAWGRHIYATGDDPQAAQLAGIDTNKVLLSVYVVAGLICALAAWASIGRVGSVSPNAGQLENLDSITAVVIGGTSLFGGRGAIMGTLIGALVVGVFRNGLALAGVEVLWQQFAIGLLIIIAVATDQWIRRA
ncbi:ABC transporter permease [Thiolinea disciformis]|uniref:ABC transporter permease n=1 Tax=Thiolinea disciformis TaxID=125614 RepID=UPI00036A4835|nr:ABC transporter permease [Thiolinea disciformis]